VTERLVVLGLGGHAHMVAAIALRIHGTMPTLVDSAAVPADGLLLNGVGNIPVVGSSGLGRRAAVFEAHLTRMRKVIDPSAIILGICEGDAFPGAIVNARAHVGRNAIINTGAIIEHDCIIGAHSHIAPGAVLCGTVHVGEMSHVGARAVVKQGVKIGKNCVIGMGAIVRKDVPDGATFLCDCRLILQEDLVTPPLDQSPV